MRAKLLEGKPIRDKIIKHLKEELQSLKEQSDRVAKLVTVFVGENPSSLVYTKSQKRLADELNIEFELAQLSKDITPVDFENKLTQLNRDFSVNGILLQLPLPEQLNLNKAISLIDPMKDVEGIHPTNLGSLVTGKFVKAPCTSLAVMELLKSTKVDLYGMEVCMVGHSEIVGKPLVLMLLNEFATVTCCHIATGERGHLEDFVSRAEILIVAVGKPEFIKGEWLKENAIVIDVGINKIKGKLVGDVEFEKALSKVSFITPVPGGVGSLTTAMLMRNLVESFKLQIQKTDYK